MQPSITASRIRLRPRHDVVHVSRGRTALGMDLEGLIGSESPRQGLFVYQTRMLSRYRWTINGKEPQLSTQSPVEQHSWLAYYFQAPRNCKKTPAGECNPLQETIELRIARVVGEGMHEDVELTNHTQIETSISLQLEVDADFVSRKEIKEKRQQRGSLRKKWSKTTSGEWIWRFDYECKHHYDHQGNSGTASLQRAITLRLRADSRPSQGGKRISFRIKLAPHQSWKACLIWRPEVDGNLLPVELECNALLGSNGEYSRKSDHFLSQAARICTASASDLTHAVQRVLDRSRLDLIGLRLFDLDQGTNNWKLAAGIPTYLALFGRDMLASAWQASLLSNDMNRGALSLVANMQAREKNDWRDAQPGR
ncbi:MAG TPA: glycogen debranching N-terminal domain-containing protein, partial [Candidatus Angelobacter sp.]|nr:glycogen debranching N-terminal domain-containing protein [Candidatus Angelobacter sp.]